MTHYPQPLRSTPVDLSDARIDDHVDIRFRIVDVEACYLTVSSQGWTFRVRNEDVVAFHPAPKLKPPATRAEQIEAAASRLVTILAERALLQRPPTPASNEALHAAQTNLAALFGLDLSIDLGAALSTGHRFQEHLHHGA
jgi:hypothetical protein